MTRGSAERIVVLPFGDHSRHTPATRPRRTRALTGAGSRDGGVGGADAIPSVRTLAGFSLSAASCAIKNDEHRLLGVIEAAFGDHASFESPFRALLCSRVFGPSAQCRGSRADGSGSSRSERRAGAATDGSVDGRGRVARVCHLLRRVLSPAPAERRRGEGGGVEAMMCRQASGSRNSLV